MAERDFERDMAHLMGAHLLALSKASAVYQAELAKIFLGLEDEEERVEAGPAYKMVRDLEKVGVASSLFDQSPEGVERRLRSFTGGNAAFLENWMTLLQQPWQAYWKAMAGGSGKDES